MAADQSIESSTDSTHDISLAPRRAGAAASRCRNRAGTLREATHRRSRSSAMRLESLESRLLLSATPSLAGLAADVERISVYPNPGLGPMSEIAVHDGRLWFAAGDPTSGIELWSSDGTSGGTQRALDINPHANDSRPGGFVQVGDRLFFSADDGSTGRELWVIESNQIRRVRDLVPGSNGSDPTEAIAWGDRLAFVARASRNGPTIWVSDGSEAGTIPLPITTSTHQAPRNLIALGDRLLWIGSARPQGDDANLLTLPREGGSPVALTNFDANTQVIEARDRGDGSVVFTTMQTHEGRLELWTSRGDRDSTRPLIRLEPSEWITNVDVFGGRVTLTVSGADGVRLMTAPPGSDRLDVIGGQRLGLSGEDHPGAVVGFANGLGVVIHGATSDRLVIVSDDAQATATTLDLGTVLGGEFRLERLVRDPDTNGLRVVARGRDDLAHLLVVTASTAEPTGWAIQSLARVEPGQWFDAEKAWRLTPDGPLMTLTTTRHPHHVALVAFEGDTTRIVAQFDHSGVPTSMPSGFTVVGNNAYFTAYHPETGRELYRTDGTPGGTRRVADLQPGPAGSDPFNIVPLGATGDILFLTRNSQGAVDLWRSDGQANGRTALIQSFPSEQEGMFVQARELTPTAGGAVFLVDRGGERVELWTTDGTAEGTRSLHSFRTDGTPVFLPRPMAEPAADSQLARTAVSERMKTPLNAATRAFGTAASSARMAVIQEDASIAVMPTFGSVSNLTPWNGGAVVFAPDESGTQQVWFTDGQRLEPLPTGLPVEISRSIDRVLAAGGSLFLVTSNPQVGPTLWQWSQGRAVPVRLGDGGWIGETRVVGDALIVVREFDGTRVELWKVEGGRAERLFQAEAPRWGDSSGWTSLTEITPLGERGLGFVLIQGDRPATLYISDGTAAGTRPVENPVASAGSEWGWGWNGLSELEGVGSTLFFVQDDGATGRELWKVQDGVAVQVADLNPGGNSSNPRDLTALGDRVVFHAQDDRHGEEPWVSDGTASGTIMLADLNDQSNPEEMMNDPMLADSAAVRTAVQGGTRRNGGGIGSSTATPSSPPNAGGSRPSVPSTGRSGPPKSRPIVRRILGVPASRSRGPEASPTPKPPSGVVDRGSRVGTNARPGMVGSKAVPQPRVIAGADLVLRPGQTATKAIRVGKAANRELRTIEATINGQPLNVPGGVRPNGTILLRLPKLPTGRHEVVITAIDDSGAVGSDSFYVTVSRPNRKLV